MKFIELAILTCLQDSPNSYTTHIVVRGCMQHVVLRSHFAKNSSEPESGTTFVLHISVPVSCIRKICIVCTNVHISIAKCALICACIVDVTN